MLLAKASSAMRMGEFAFNSLLAPLLSALTLKQDSMRLARDKKILRKRLYVVVFATIAVNAIATTFVGCSSEKESGSPVKSLAEGSQPKQRQTVSAVEHPDWYLAETCRECHEAEYDDWLGSHHHLAQRRLDPSRNWKTKQEESIN
jgi:hypothetical protein